MRKRVICENGGTAPVGSGEGKTAGPPLLHDLFTNWLEARKRLFPRLSDGPEEKESMENRAEAGREGENGEIDEMICIIRAYFNKYIHIMFTIQQSEILCGWKYYTMYSVQYFH